MNTTATKVRKQARQQTRSIAVVVPLDEAGQGGVVRITTERTGPVEYDVERVGCDWEGEGFRLTKVCFTEGEDTVYHVLLSRESSTCECRGWLRHGHCKHVSGLEALKARGLI